MKISTSVAENGIVLLEVAGRVDSYTIPRLDTALKDLLAQGHSRLVLDASRMDYISSRGLRVLLCAQQDARQLGGEVRLFGLNAPVRQVLELAGFDRLLHINDTRQEAMEGW